MELWTLLLIAALGALDLWLAVPAGLGLGLPPQVVGAASGSGAFAGSAAVVVAGGWVRRRWEARRTSKGEGRRGRLRSIWERYGVAGVGLLSPLLATAPLGAALGVALGAPRGPLLLWTGLGVAVASAALTAGAQLAWAGLRSLLPG
ncbi:MAG: small multi-drug export protein [Halobacteria archaeon]